MNTSTTQQDTEMFHLEIDNGLFSRFDHQAGPRSIKAYFDSIGRPKPRPITVRGWSFSKMYLISGTEENGQAVAMPDAGAPSTRYFDVKRAGSK